MCSEGMGHVCLCCRLGRYEDAETRLKQAIKYADDLHSSRTPEEMTLSFVKALEVIPRRFESH